MGRWERSSGGAILVVSAALALCTASLATECPAAKVDATEVARGAYLAALGNCNTCHTAAQGPTFAGGRALETPFGTVYATNVTPDSNTGIGGWTLPDFRRAMHDGIDNKGRHLYPAFPYDHFAHVADDDVAAIYAYLMTRKPVHAETPANRVLIPRPAVAAWNALYLRHGAVASDVSRSTEWNRGRYLVDGLGHCGGCHTPRDALGGEKAQEALAGGEAESWRAPALNERVAAPAPWTLEQMTRYLRTGYDDQHGVAAGPMAAVTRNLAGVPEGDVRAIATYIIDAMGHRAPAERPGSKAATADVGGPGAALYESTCAGCHDRASRGIPLDRSTTVSDTVPTNLLRITLDGIVPPEGQAGKYMPSFRGAFTETQLADLVIYVRARFGSGGPWQDVAAGVNKAMKVDPREKKS
jgi:mono/diheme cytochrome c family protein